VRRLTITASPGTLIEVPRTAYLDANVYNDIERKAVPEDEVEATRAARRRGALTIRLGVCDLEESALAVWNNNPELALRRLAIMQDLAGFDSMLHQPADVLEMSIRAYATGTLRPSPLLPLARRLEVANRIAEGIGNPAAFGPMVTEIVAGVREQKEKHRKLMAEARERALKKIKARWSPREVRKLSFEEYFVSGAAGWAEDLARPHGLVAACRERGLDGLLKVPAVRLTVGVLLSQIHAQVVAERLPEGGDGYDVWHAIQASTASVFVTNDQRLVAHMNRIPGGTSVRAVKSLRELLDTLGQ